MKSDIEAKIEYQRIIGEANPGGYQPVRFTRIKYKASPDTHVDIRQFQRGYNDEGEEEYYPTKKGFRFPEREFRRVVKEYALMPESYVHPTIVRKSFALLNDGQFESAVLQAFKTIETSISVITLLVRLVFTRIRAHIVMLKWISLRHSIELLWQVICSR